MMSERIPTRVAVRSGGSWLLAALFLAAPPTVAAAGDGTDHECGMAESCLVMSPSPQLTSSEGARGAAHDRDSSGPAGGRRASRKARTAKKNAPSTPTLVATDVATAERLGKGRTR
jgi:hypothetical protein